MKKAIKLEDKEYKKLQNNFYTTVKGIYDLSINNIRKTIT